MRRSTAVGFMVVFVALFGVTFKSHAASAPEPGTKTVTVTRGGQSFETTVLDPAVVNGREVRRGSVIVRFRPGVDAAQQAEAHRAAAAEDVHALGLPRADRVDVRPGAEERALAIYRARTDVEYAQLDGIEHASYTPNDTRFSELWGMTKIHAPEAWDVTKSSSAIKIAILDCGIYSSSSLFSGPDGFGHVDVRTKVVLEANFSTSLNGPDDFCNHGTHVAGTAAAVTNNGVGVAGAGHDASVLNGKVLDDSGSGSDSSVINGITWAADNGAKVLNLSLGAAAPCSQAVQDGVNYAWNKGAVIVVAAGNMNSGTPSNLSLCANTLSVAATDSNDARASFSNYGLGVDVAAPGVGILSSNYVGGYSIFDGTSMATPHVSGLAALVWSAMSTSAAAAPTPADIVARIKNTATKIAGTGVYWEAGRIDAAAAVAPPAPPTINWAAQNSVDFDADHKTDLGALYRGLSPADSLWYATSSSGGGPFQIYFGATTDIPVPGDYNGDGKTDAVIYRPSTGLWYGPQTGAAVIVIQMNLGQPGDIPIPGDYDGDGKTDPAIWRPSTGLFFAVLSGGGVKSSTFGVPTDVPVPRDYDGDGKTDFAIYRADATPDHLGLWYSPLSGGGLYQIYFGAPGDIPVPGDYNGDKKAEAVIFREATGLWYGPFNGAPGLFQLLLGGPGDVPIPGYYDNNLTEDPAIYHKATGLWFALNSGGGITRIDGLGLPTDVPIEKRPALSGGL
jgi:thermitase